MPVYLGEFGPVPKTSSLLIEPSGFLAILL
jgi:hypothetical protein